MKNSKKITSDLETLLPILIGVWRRFTKLSGPADRLQTREFRTVVEQVREIEAILHKGIKNIKTSSNETLGAYLLYHWVIHYQQGLSLIGEIPSLPKRVLEICSGPAPFAYAALKFGATDVWAIDKNPTALKLGAEVAGRSGYPITTRTWEYPQLHLPLDGSFDLIILPYCLQELFPPSEQNYLEKQVHFIHSLDRLLNPNGFLLVVDSSQTEYNHRFLTLRNRMVHEGYAIQAPCVWKGDCPALAMHSLCFAQRELEKPFLIKEIQRASEINLSSLKMSYCLFKKRHTHWPRLAPNPAYRIISPLFESAVGQRYYLCGTDGKRNLDSNLKIHSAQTKAFDYLRRGELISLRNALERGPSWHITQESTVQIEAALGKPVKEIAFDLNTPQDKI